MTNKGWSPERRRQAHKDMKEKVYRKLGNQCGNPACQWLNPDGSRGCIDSRCLQIDHVEDDGYKERRVLGFHTDKIYRLVLADQEGRYQLLCANCNWIKKSQSAKA